MLHEIQTGAIRFAASYPYHVIGGWAWLFVGTLLATWVAWDGRRVAPHRGRRWAWLSVFVPPLALIALLASHHPKPMASAFGEPLYLDASGNPIGQNGARRQARGFPPVRMLLGGLGGGLFPGLGQLVYGRWWRMVIVWTLIAFSGFFIAAYLLGIERTWPIPARLLNEAQRTGEASINFRVPGYFFAFACVELVAFVAWAYADTVRLGDAYAETFLKEDERFRRMFYNLVVKTPDGKDERVPVEKESFSVGSAERCDYRIDKGGVRPQHVVFYFHHKDERSLILNFRCPDEDFDVLHNGSRSSSGVIRPGDGIEVGDAQFLFRQL